MIIVNVWPHEPISSDVIKNFDFMDMIWSYKGVIILWFNYKWIISDADDIASWLTKSWTTLWYDFCTTIIRLKHLIYDYIFFHRYRADHHSGYVADVTYEGEAIPYVAPAKPAYPKKEA